MLQVALLLKITTCTTLIFVAYDSFFITNVKDSVK